MATLLPSLPDRAWKLLWGSASSAKKGVREKFRVDTHGPVLRSLLGLTRMDEHRVTEVLRMQPGEEWSNTNCYRSFICYLMQYRESPSKSAPDLRRLQGEGGEESTGLVMGNARPKLLCQPTAVL